MKLARRENFVPRKPDANTTHLAELLTFCLKTEANSWKFLP